MARKGYGRPASLVQIAGSGTTYPDDGSSPVGSNEWNANRDTTGILGFTKATSSISSNNVNVTDSYIEITGGGDIHTLAAVTTALSTDYYPSDTSTKSYAEGDLLYLVKAAGAGATNLKNQQGGAGAGKITTLTGGDKALSATVPTILIARTIGSNLEWVEYGGGTASDLDTTNFASGIIDTDISSVAGTDTTIPSAKAVKTYVDAQIATEDTIAELNDTTISGVGSGELLKWNGSAWINQTLTEAGIVDGNLGTPSALVGTNISGTAANLTAGVASTAVTVSNDAITGAKIADDAVDSEHYTDGSIDLAHLAADSVDGTKIADNAINSEHVTAGSIDLAHMSSESVDEDNLHISNSGNNGEFLSKQSGDAGGLTWATVPAGYNQPTIGSTAIPSGQTVSTLAGLTLTSPVINTQITGSALLDSDTMSGTSATTVSSSESIKAYVDSSVASNVTLKGDYNASTDNPSLDDGSPIAGIKAGDHYVVSTAGDFFTETLQAGDSIIAKQDSPTTLAHWITVNNNVVTPVVGANIANDAIDSQHYADGSIDNAHIADDAVGADELAANAVVNASVASGAAIDYSKLAALTSARLLEGNGSNVATGVDVTGDVTISNAGVTAIGAQKVVNSMVADDAIGADELAANAVVTASIVNDAIDGTKIADDVINSEHYVDGSIDTAHIADNQITLAKLAGGTDGNLISYDANGDPVAVATGNSGQVLTSAGAGAPPTFATASGSWVGTATTDLNMAGTADASKGDIIDVNRLTLNIKAHTFDADGTNNADISGESQLYVRQLKLASGAVDSNNDGLFVRLKKNGSNVYLQLA